MKGLIVFLACALGAALLVIAYMLGQKHAAVPPLAPIAAADTAPPPAYEQGAHLRWAQPRADEDAEPIAQDPPRRRPRDPAPDEEAAPAPTSGESWHTAMVNSMRESAVAPVPSSAANPDLADYFDRVHALQVGPASNDQRGFAQGLLSEALNGDTSGFDDLLRQAKDAEQKARDLKPPRGAEDYHRQLIDLLATSTRLLAAERQAIASKNTDQLSTLVGNAQALEQKARALSATEDALSRGKKPR